MPTTETIAPTAEDSDFDLRDDRPGVEATTPTEIPVAGWRQVGKRVVAELKEDRVGLLGAGVAFKAILSIFPMIIAAVSVYGLVVDPETVTSQIDRLAQYLPEQAADVIGTQASEIAQTTASGLGVALALSLAGALWSASGGISGLITALNAAYDVEDGRSFVAKRGLAIAFAVVAIIAGAVLLTGLVIAPAILETVDLGVVTEILIQVARWVLVAAIVAAGLAVMYRVAPARPSPSFAWTAPGALIATALWLVSSAAFSFAVSRFGSFNETYGSLAGVIVLMLWLWISALIVMLGGYINAELERQTGVDTLAEHDISTRL